VDCVSSRGGKLQALERVRTLFSVPRGRCVAAGDSGNDILMLEGTLLVHSAVYLLPAVHVSRIRRLVIKQICTCSLCCMTVRQNR